MGKQGHPIDLSVLRMANRRNFRLYTIELDFENRQFVPVQETMDAGFHSVVWDGTDAFGKQVASVS